MSRLRVLRKIKADTITANDALFIRLHINAGYPVKVSDHNYFSGILDLTPPHSYELLDIDLYPGQDLQPSVVHGHGFFGVGSVRGCAFCYVLEKEDKINSSGEWIMQPPAPEYKPIGLKEDKNMGMMDGNFMQQMLGMKMLKSIFNSDAKDINIGKLIMMQQVLGGSAIQVTDVIKAKIMEQFALDDKNVDDLPLDKLLLLQMLDKGSIDIQQLIQFKMMNKLLEEDF